MSEASSENDLWMVPFADLMTTLVILFLAMYGFASMEKEEAKKKAALRHEREVAVTEQEKRLVEDREKEAALAGELEREVRKRLPKGAYSMRVDGERVQLTLASPLVFDSGSAALRPEIVPFLDRVAEALQALPNEVLVEGHTDALQVRSGPYRTNWELSAARAFAVIEHLAGRGLDPGRFTAYGHAQYRPVDKNRTRAGRARNRRIEISLLRTEAVEKEGSGRAVE